jgi:hypothetical protein
MDGQAPSEPAQLTSGQVIAAPALQTSGCQACAAAARTLARPALSGYIYAVGRIAPRFPRPSVEKELAQVMRASDTRNLTDAQALRRVLLDRQNRYLVRQLCWVMTIQGMDTYIVTPSDPVDFELLTGCLRPEPNFITQ